MKEFTMIKDYALCSHEELAAKRKRLNAKKNSLGHLSSICTEHLEQRLSINRLEIEIAESEWAIASKESGILSYIMYRLRRIIRVNRNKADLIYNRFLIIYPSIKRMWMMIWND